MVACADDVSGHAPGTAGAMIGELLGKAESFSDDAPKVLVMIRSRSDLKVVKRIWISALPSETEQQEEDLDMVLAVCDCCGCCD
jgi:hypothetical protein